MIYLKIENNLGYFSKDGRYESIDKMDGQDLFCLAQQVMTDDDFDMEEYDESKLANKAHQIIYTHVYELLKSVKDNKSSLKTKCDNLYKEAFDKYNDTNYPLQK